MDVTANLIEILVFGWLVTKCLKARVVAAVTGWAPLTWIAMGIGGYGVAVVVFVALIVIGFLRPDTLRQWLFAITG